MAQLLLFGLIIGFIWYTIFLTTPVPINNLNNVTKNYDTVAYTSPNYVTNEMGFIGTALVVVAFIMTKTKEAKTTRISERKFKEIVSKEIKKKQTTPLPDGNYELPEGKFNVDLNVLLRYRTENKVSKPFKYVGQVTGTDSNERENYYIVSGDPISGMLDDFVPSDERLTIADKCPDCGRFYDVKFITPEEIKELKDIKYSFQ